MSRCASIGVCMFVSVSVRECGHVGVFMCVFV